MKATLTIVCRLATTPRALLSKKLNFRATESRMEQTKETNDKKLNVSKAGER